MKHHLRSGNKSKKHSKKGINAQDDSESELTEETFLQKFTHDPCSDSSFDDTFAQNHHPACAEETALANQVENDVKASLFLGNKHSPKIQKKSCNMSTRETSFSQNKHVQQKHEVNNEAQTDAKPAFLLEKKAAEKHNNDSMLDDCDVKPGGALLLEKVAVVGFNNEQAPIDIQKTMNPAQKPRTLDQTALEDLTITIIKPKKFGISLTDSSNAVEIAGVDPSTASQEIQDKFQNNDQIISIDGSTITSVMDATEKLKAPRLGKQMTFQISRRKQDSQASDTDQSSGVKPGATVSNQGAKQASPTAGSSDFLWQWCREDMQWITYSPVDQILIEQAFETKGEIMLSAPGNRQPYLVNTEKLFQKNLNRGTVRDIRRFSKDEIVAQASNFDTSEYPASWSQVSGVSSYLLVSLESSSAEFTHLSDHFARTCSSAQYSITSIARVQNMNLYNEYKLFRKTLVTELGVDHINEMKLFHGTDPRAVQGICRDGFDWRVCGKNGTVYGHGSYFAMNSSYSADYARPDSYGECKMFVASVLVGKYAMGSGNLVKPPEGCHSVVNMMSTPSIFVVFLIKQAYPEYLISFRKI